MDITYEILMLLVAKYEFYVLYTFFYCFCWCEVEAH